MKPGKLTAVVFIRPVAAVVVTIAQPLFGNTSVVITREVVGSTGGGEMSGAVGLIRTVAAVVHAVAPPGGPNAALVVAGERIRRAGGPW